MTNENTSTRDLVHFRIVGRSSGPKDVIDVWKWIVEINGDRAGDSIWYESEAEARTALNLVKRCAAEAPVDPAAC